MVNLNISRSIKILAASAAGIAGMASAPALANSSATAADVTAPIRAASHAKMGHGDAQFRQLFASWQALDTGNTGPQAPTVEVAVPSRMPLDSAKLTSNYGMRNHPVLGGRRRHKGVDLSAPTGTPIYATANGVVSKAQRFSSYGLYVAIEHGAKLQTRFAHMSRIAVAPGQRVEKGDIIGFVGSTGRSTGPHLHYEVRIAGQAVNPMPYMIETQAQIAFDLNSRSGGRGGE